MGTKEVVGTLSSIPIGTIIAWVSVIAGLIVGTIAGTIKLYKVFEKTHSLGQEISDFYDMVNKHEEQLVNIDAKLNLIQDNLHRRDKTDLKKIRYSIVRAGEEYVSKNEITIRQLKTLEEMFEDYQERHGNGYVATLMKKVRALPVIGRLDDNDDDIPESLTD